MNNFHEQYVVDENGNRSAVLLPGYGAIYSGMDGALSEDYVCLLDDDVFAVTNQPGEGITGMRLIDPRPSQRMVSVVASPVIDVIR